jgi:VWFA-related protein
MFKKSLVLLFACLLTFGILPPLFSELEEHVSVDVIEVWVKVTNKAKQPVTDLGPQDFQIFIDGKKMTNRCFDKTFESASRIETSGDQPDSNSASGLKRKFIFFFDLLHSSSRDVDYLKNKLGDFLNTSFHENDEGMVFVLTPSVHLGVVQRMTSNKEALIDVIGRMHGNPDIGIRLRNNEKQLIELLYSFSAPGPVLERRVQPDMARQAKAVARSFAAQEENLSRFTLNSFLSIASYLDANHYDGRLVMIYVSGGFPLHPGQNYFQIVERALEDSNEFGTNELGFREHPEYYFDKEVRNTIGLLNRLNVTIYSVDCAGLAENDRGPERDNMQLQRGYNAVALAKELQDSLVMVARETGGIVFTNTQNYKKGLAEIASDLSQQYWLCSTAPAAKKAGSYHKIDVKVARNDVNIRHRQGYTD